MEQPRSAQQKFVDVALTLFSERGFYGTSLADVAKELGLTKQSVLHHFRTKEALYAEVLRQLSVRFEAIVREVQLGPSGVTDRLKLYVEKLHLHLQAEPRDARLIARELLDNLDRAATSRTWFLKSFLDESVALLLSRPGWQDRSEDEARAAVYQLIGAINYFAISEPTLHGIWGQQRTEEMAKQFLPTLLHKL